ncbi:MAG: AtpZ/AtpI family protein [Planctomycetes bacterium]|nr:AtpZ/AtpI family protein [Planctomycetota bacterium]
MPSGKLPKEFAKAYSLAMELPLHVVILGGAGYFADDYFETEPVLLIAGIILGVASMVYRVLYKDGNRNEEAKK